jgi:hypothetical protein
VAVAAAGAAVVFASAGGPLDAAAQETPQSASPAPGTSGPLVGDQAAMSDEVSCMQQLAENPANNMVGYWPAIGAPEHTDNIKTGVYPCATWTGDSNGPNQVYQYPSESNFFQITFVVFDGPSAGYLQGGGTYPPAPGTQQPTGQFVSKFDPSTGKELWRTYLTNINLTGQWIAAGSMAILKDGSIVAAAGPTLWKLDRNTGAILQTTTVPIDPDVQPATGANLDGLTVAPDAGGTILMKTQTRPNGCPTQGNGAMGSCQAQYGPQPNTTVVAVDPTSFETLATLTLDQSVTARPITTQYNGTIYVLMNGAKTLVRAIWDPTAKTITQDSSWAPSVIMGGQTGGTAPGLMGKWVVWNTNANNSTTTPQCDGVVSLDNPNDIHRICPWGTTMPQGKTISGTPALPGVDPDNSMFFVQDWFLGGVYAIRVDQTSGALTQVWGRTDWNSSDYFTMVGPKDKRVLISQNLGPDFSTATIASGFAYTESVLWADEATGKTLAESAYNDSTAVGSLINMGYGGRYYTMGNAGTLYIYQVEPCSTQGAAPAVPQSTTHC